MKAHYSLIGLMIFLLNAQSSTAQESNFDLKNYKTTDYERSELSLYLRLTESSSGESHDQDTPDYLYNDRNSSFGSDITGTYHSINYKPELLTETRVNFSSNIDLNKYEREIPDYNYSYHDGKVVEMDLNVSHNYERYYGKKLKNFIYLKPTVNTSIYSYNNFNVLGADTSKSKYFNVGMPSTLLVEFGHGYGRIEFVEDAVEAIYILKELEEKGILAKKVNSSMIEVLANKIKKLKEERYLDGRIYRAHVMEELVALFKEENWVANESVSLFNTLNDYHFMAGINNRKSGSKFKYGLAPDLALVKNLNEYGSDYSIFSDGISFIVGYENYVPVDIKWQRSFISSLRTSVDKQYTKYDNEDSFTKNTSTPLIINFSNQYAVGYLPNTRTQLYAAVFGNWSYLKNLNNSEYNSFNSNINIGLNLAGNYYFSEHLRLNASFSLADNILQRTNYIYNSALMDNEEVLNNGNVLKQSFNVSLNYYIF